MLHRDLHRLAMKRNISAQPLVNNNTQRILIACRTRFFAHNLLRSYICHCPGHIRHTTCRNHSARCNSYVKTTKQDFSLASHQHMLWPDITVNNPLIVGILQCGGNLPDVGHNGIQRDARPSRMALAQRTARGIVSDDKVGIALLTKIQDMYNIWVAYFSQQASLINEILRFSSICPCWQCFNKNLIFKVDMLTQICSAISTSP